MDNTAEQAAVAQDDRTAMVKRITERLMTLEAMLDAVKPLYTEKDNLVVDLMKLIGADTEVTFGDQVFSVVDNFKEKNVVFRPAGVRRFELAIDSVAARTEKLMKKMAKAKI